MSSHQHDISLAEVDFDAIDDEALAEPIISILCRRQ